MTFFILGKNQAVSLAEVLNKYKTTKFIFGQDFLLCDDNYSEMDMEDLGGIIKVGNVVHSFSPDIAKVKEWTINYILELFQSGKLDKGSKFYFGFSFYDMEKKYQKAVKILAMELKRELRENGINSRWVISKEKQLSSVIVQKNNLLRKKNGIEIIFFLHDGKLYTGETEQVQNFEEYSELDYGRPARDAKSGMLPPKLAKILVNLADIGKEKIILDPFCGSGTILQEALLLGYKNIIGSDLSGKAIKDTKINLDWLEEKFPEIKKNKVSLFNMPVEKISDTLKSNSVDGIVTEPYLGPSRDFHGAAYKKIIDQLADLYLKAFGEFKKILKANGTVVMIWPVFNVGREIKFLPIIGEVERMGFVQEELLPEDVVRDKNFNNNFWSFRNTIIYKREEQRVMREIIKFRRGA